MITAFQIIGTSRERYPKEIRQKKTTLYPLVLWLSPQLENLVPPVGIEPTSHIDNGF